MFFEGRPVWFQEPSVDRPLPTTERQASAWPTTRVYQNFTLILNEILIYLCFSHII